MMHQRSHEEEERHVPCTRAFWPYALQQTSESLRYMPQVGYSKSPLKIFSGSTVRPNYKKHDFHPFSCLTYVLDSALQANKPFLKWDDLKSTWRPPLLLSKSRHQRCPHSKYNHRICLSAISLYLEKSIPSRLYQSIVNCLFNFSMTGQM